MSDHPDYDFFLKINFRTPLIIVNPPVWQWLGGVLSGVDFPFGAGIIERCFGERALPACVSHDARVGRKSSTRCAAFVYDIHWEQCDTIRATFFHTWDWWCPDRSHQTFRPVLAVKLRGLCWEILDVSWHQFSHYYSRRCWRMVLELTGVISPWGSLHTRAKSRDHGIVRARCKRKCPKATVPTHPQHHVVVWSRILECSVKLYVTTLNQMLFQWMSIHAWSSHVIG